MEKPRLTLQQGREVRRLRAKGLKLWEVAATIGCSRATVTRVLAGPGNLESRQFEWMPGPLRLSVAERAFSCSIAAWLPCGRVRVDPPILNALHRSFAPVRRRAGGDQPRFEGR